MDEGFVQPDPHASEEEASSTVSSSQAEASLEEDTASAEETTQTETAVEEPQAETELAFTGSSTQSEDTHAGTELLEEEQEVSNPEAAVEEPKTVFTEENSQNGEQQSQQASTAVENQEISAAAINEEIPDSTEASSSADSHSQDFQANEALPADEGYEPDEPISGVIMNYIDTVPPTDPSLHGGYHAGKDFLAREAEQKAREAEEAALQEREESDAATIQGLGEALTTGDREAAVDIQVKPLSQPALHSVARGLYQHLLSLSSGKHSLKLRCFETWA